MDLHSAKEMALRLMDLHIQEPGWTFEFMHAKRRFGVCRHRRKIIELSKPLTLLNEIEIITDTILHEIGHAIAGYEAAHGPEWKKVASQLGARTESRCTVQNVVRIPGKLQYRCPNCHHITRRFRRFKKRQACGKCCRQYSNGKFDQRFVIVPYHGEPVQERQPPAAQTGPTQLSLI